MDKSEMPKINDQQIEHLIQSSLFNDAAQESHKGGTFFAIQDRLGDRAVDPPCRPVGTDAYRRPGFQSRRTRDVDAGD